MNLQFKQGEFIAAAFEADQFPRMQTSRNTQIPEIAIVGRSNVGKSTLINSLLGKKLAKTSSTPGKTQSINFFSIDQQLCLVDLPGYGYAKVSHEIKEKWAKLIEAYLNSRTSLRLILFLIDARREPTEQDRQFLQWASFRRIPILLIFTKADKMKEEERKRAAGTCLASFKDIFPEPLRFLHYSIKDPHARINLIKQITSCI